MSMRLMIPTLLGQMIGDPGRFEKEFLNFLEAAGYDTKSVAKTIGKMELYHFRSVDGLQSQTFFTGQFENPQTNIPGSDFIRPKGEHFVIYGIKVERAVSATFGGLDWEPGAQGAFMKNANMTIKVNGVDRLLNVPLSSAMEDLTTADKGIMILDEPIIWGGEVQLVITISAKTNQWLGATNEWIRVTPMGIGLFS